MAKLVNPDSLDQDYLEKNNVRGLINQALLQTAIFQPEDPFLFLANQLFLNYFYRMFTNASPNNYKNSLKAKLIMYKTEIYIVRDTKSFEWERSKCSALKYSCIILNCQTYPNKVTELGIQQSFLMFSQQKGTEDLKSITGSMYMDLIQLLCVELQGRPEEELRLLDNIYIPPRSVLSYRQFRAGIHCCLLYKSYLKAIRALFTNVVTETVTSSAVISRMVATQLTYHLNKQVDVETGQEIKPNVNEETSCEVRNSTETDSITLDEFVTMATDLFWKKVSIEAILQ